MTFKKLDPATGAFLIAIVVILGAAIFLFALIVAIPLAIIGAVAFFGYRYWRLQKYKSADLEPVTIKHRPDYADPQSFRQSIMSSNWLLDEHEEETGRYSCQPLKDAFYFVVYQLYAAESFHEAPLKPHTADRITMGRYYDQLEAWQRKISDENNFELFMRVLVGLYVEMCEHFPAYAFQSSSEPAVTGLSTPLQFSNESAMVSTLLTAFFDADLKKRQLFTELRDQIEDNHRTANDETLTQYFAKTPFRAFFRVDIPINLFDETRFAGMWVVAPQGQGKTTLLHALVKDDLEKNASIILIDSKGDLIEPFLDHPALRERRVVIGPDHPIGINPLDIPKGDINKAVESLEYLFASLLDFKLTSTQSMLFQAVFRTLIQAVPNPNLATFQEFLAKDGEKKYARHLAELEPDLQNFFANEYNGQNIRERRQEVLQRLRALLGHDLLRSMLMAPKTTFRISEAMDRGAIIIVNNSRGKLGNKGAEFFGRWVIAQVLASAQERSFRPDREKKPVYFYIDEAHTVVANDERITDVYHECRSQKIALCCAHQETSQVSEKVLSAFQNCAIRMSHPDDEARKMSISLRMDLRKLTGLKRGQFGAYIRGLSKEGIVVNVQKPDLSQLNPSKQPYRARLPRPLEEPIITLDDIIEPAAPATPGRDESPVPKAEIARAEPTMATAPKPQPEPSSPPPKKEDSDYSPTW